MLKRLKQAWKRDRLGVLGVGSAAVAFVLWAFPVRFLDVGTNFIEKPFWEPLPSGLLGDAPRTSVHWFTDDRLPSIAAFLALAFVLLLLRRR
jgi:hypothetical protein